MNRRTRGLPSYLQRALRGALRIRSVLERPVISRRRGAAAAVALLALSGPSLAQTLRAVVEVEAPAKPSFVLRATVPVPPGTYPRPDGLVPLQVRNSDGSLVPTQVETVTRYSVAARGADVVEVLARVDLPAGTPQGTPVTYQILENPHPSASIPLKPEVRAFLTTPSSLMLIGEDALGNLYRLDLLGPVNGNPNGSSVRLMRRGSAAVQLRTHGVMMPTASNLGPPAGTLPHLFGAHAYITAWAGERAISVDLRIHNGLSGLDKSDPADDALSSIHFRSLSLWVQGNWRLHRDVVDPAVGAPYASGAWTVYPIVGRRSDGTVHFMPRQAEMHRRLALAHPAEVAAAKSLLEEQGLGFVRRGSTAKGELWSWWNRGTPGYYPQRHVLPKLDHIPDSVLQGDLDWQFWNANTAIVTGNAGQFPISSKALGWAHPWGVSYGGATGGAEIDLYDGHVVAETASQTGYRAAQLALRMYADRTPLQLWRKDGNPVSVDDLLVYGSGTPYVPMNFFLKVIKGPDPFGFNKAPTWQTAWVRTAGIGPDYENELQSFAAVDFQHYIRYTRNAKTLAWLGNDALSKDELRHAAEIFHLSYHEHPNSSNGTLPSFSALGSWNFVQANQGKGYPFGRGEAWGMDAVISAFALGDDAYRASVRGWLSMISDTVALSQIPCSGFIQAEVNKWLGGQWRVRSSPEQAIVENALWSLKERVFRDTDIARFQQTEAVIRDSVYAMIGPLAWAQQYQAPWFLLGVGPLDLAQPLFCHGVPPGAAGNGPDGFQTWSSFAYGYELTADPQFLSKAKAMGGGGNLLAHLEGLGLTNIYNTAALLALLQ